METEKITKQTTQGELQTYEGFPLKADLLVGMKDSGYLDPFLPQENILLPLLEGKDLHAESVTSFQKTLAIVISALQRIESEKKECQVLIILPTRELCREGICLAEEIGNSFWCKGLNVLGVVGGTPLETEKTKLQEGPSIVIGTPGRLLAAIETGSLELKGLKLLILDEVDELFGRGFQEQILAILKLVPPHVQMAIISGTTPIEIQNLVDLSLRDPVCIRLEVKYVDMKESKHFKVSLEEGGNKADFLVNFYKNLIERRHSLIYCKKDEDVKKLVEIFKQENFYVAALDRSVPGENRMGIIREFLGSSEQILVTLDPAFFGEMNCTQSTIPFIIHYDLPSRKEEYQKNFGVLQRFSKHQTAINLIWPSDALALKEIEDFYGIEIEELPSDVIIVELKGKRLIV